MDELSDEDKAILDFQCQVWKYAGAKNAAIRETFGITPTRYYQRLGYIRTLPGAVAYDGLLVHRLERINARQRAIRSA